MAAARMDYGSVSGGLPVKTSTLYEDSEFHDWLLTMPENVKSSFCNNDVDLQGQRVVITFIIEEGEEE